MRQAGIVLLILAWASCDTQDLQRDFEAQAFAVPMGFTHTSVTGETISADVDDWRTSPAYQSLIEIDPAFPNPPGDVALVSIPVRVREFNAVHGGLDLVTFDVNRIARRLDAIRSARDPGAYVFRFSPPALGQSGLVRVFVVDPLGELVSYGDLQLGQ